MYEHQIPVTRNVKWWTPGRVEIDNCPRKGWRAIIARQLLAWLRRLGCHILVDHETYTATRLETVQRKTIAELLYKVGKEMSRRNEPPWLVLMPPEMLTEAIKEYYRDWPSTIFLGRHSPFMQIEIGDSRQGVRFDIIADLPVYACPWVKEIVVVPDIRRHAEEYKPFRWVLKEVTALYTNRRFT